MTVWGKLSRSAPNLLFGYWHNLPLARPLALRMISVKSSGLRLGGAISGNFRKFHFTLNFQDWPTGLFTWVSSPGPFTPWQAYAVSRCRDDASGDRTHSICAAVQTRGSSRAEQLRTGSVSYRAIVVESVSPMVHRYPDTYGPDIGTHQDTLKIHARYITIQ